MKEVISKHVPSDWLKRRKKDLAKVHQYWSNIYPDEYAKDMAADYLCHEPQPKDKENA